MARKVSGVLLGLGVVAAAIAVIVITRKKGDAESPVVVYEYKAEFTVVDEADGYPLEGARISLAGGGWGLTDASGVAVFTLPSTGSYTFTMTAAGYDPYNGSFTVTE